MHILLFEKLEIEDKKLEELVNPFLKQGHTFEKIEVNSSNETIKEKVSKADILVLGNMKLTDELIKIAVKLKFISIAFTGVDHIDLEQCKKQNIAVSNASGYATNSTAETTIGLMISVMRRFNEVEDNLRNGKTKENLVGPILNEKTIGVIGTGAIGQKVITILNAFGSKVLGYSPSYISKEDARKKGYEKVELNELLANADVITIHCPLNEKTRDLISENEFKQMKKGAYLFNLARGPIVNTNALIKALESNKLRAAGIDVFNTEPPLLVTDPILKVKNLVCLPHIGWYSEQSLIKRAEIAFENIKMWLDNKQQNIVL